MSLSSWDDLEVQEKTTIEDDGEMMNSPSFSINVTIPFRASWICDSCSANP